MNSGISASGSHSQTTLPKISTEARTEPPSLLWPLVWALVIFVSLSAMDFPKPYVDDLFYNGAALNLAQGGDFSNPLLARQGFPNHFFFVYPPLHTYAVYAWLSVFGISSASLLGFQNLMHFIIAAAMLLILRRHNSPGIFSWLVPLGVAAVFLRTGLRPEGLAVALTMAGYALLIYCRTAGFRCWTAFFLIFLGASASPRTAFFAAALAAMAVWEWNGRGPENKLTRFRLCALAGLGLAAAGLVFLVLIQFRLTEFLETFRMHSGRIAHGTLYFLRGYYHNILDPTLIAILWLAFVVLCASIRRPLDSLSRVCYCLAGVFVLLGLRGALGHGSNWYVIFILFLLAGSLVKRFQGIWGTLLPWTVALLLLLANSTALIGAFGPLTGKIEQKPPQNLQTIRQLCSTPEHPLLLDGSVARYAFDYRLPAGSLDFEFAAPFPGTWATDTKPQEGDLFLLSAGTVQIIKANWYYPIEWWNVFGVEYWRQVKNPHQVYLIPARSLQRVLAAQTLPKSE